MKNTCQHCHINIDHDSVFCDQCSKAIMSVVPKSEYVDLVEAIEIIDVFMIPIIKSLLDEMKIPYFIKGEHFHGLYGLRGSPMKLMVPRDEVEDVKTLLNDI